MRFVPLCKPNQGCDAGYIYRTRAAATIERILHRGGELGTRSRSSM